LLAITVHVGRSARAIRASGGGTVGVAAVLRRELVALERALDGADVSIDQVLSPGALARVMADAIAPVRTSGKHEFERSTVWPWPIAVGPEWGAVRTDGTWHATYWVVEWPRVDFTPDMLGPVMFAPFRRTISLVMEPVNATKAARQVAQARTADLADGELRRRGGFLTTARHRREHETVEQRDAELADGHAQIRFTGYLAVTADGPDELATACVALEQAAGQARLEIRRLFGEQDTAWACVLPLGRGLT
jgi:Putative type VII ESX secretion system translocon, EccE